MSIQLLPVNIKIKIIEYLCDSECWVHLKLFRIDVFNWLKAEPGLYIQLQKHIKFKDDIWGMARLKYMDEWLEKTEDAMSEYIIDPCQINEDSSYVFSMEIEEEIYEDYDYETDDGS
jgi:hypothetical protein